MNQSLRVAGLIRVAEVSGARADAVRRGARRGDARRLRRGAYVGVDHWDGTDVAGRHLLEAHAALAATRSPALVSHRSAALLWGLPLVGASRTGVHLTFVGRSSGVSRAGVVRHGVEGLVAEAAVDGVPTTSVARTVVDLARTEGFLTGVAAGDAALRRRLVTLDELQAEVEAAGSGRGVRVARDVVAFVDGRSESPGESLSRVRMHESGLPMPGLQHVVHDEDGFVGRVDFWWEDVRVVGEFDGRSKYGIDPQARDAVERLWDEKRREDRLRRTKAAVARWTWSDAWKGAPMVTILRRAGVPLRRDHHS